MKHYESNPDMVTRRIRGESILVPVANTMDALDSIFSLNETAEFIRGKTVEGMTRDQIAALLAESYEVDLETAHADVEATVNELLAMGALVEKSA